MTPEQENKLNEVYSFVQQLRANASIPFDVQQAFKERFSDLLGFTVSGTGANAHDVTIDEAGASTHVVLNDPDVFIRITTTSGVPYDIPAFTPP